MITKIRRHIARMTGCSSGNATLLVALGMPVLIGGAGLGVDVTQWYMWKRELQFAVDQAAVAGAWARAESSTETTYQLRATQEFDANLSVTDDFNAAPTVTLADYAGGSLNSVAVSATASKVLPFTNFLTGGDTTIYAYAQASFEEGTTFTSCLIALDDDDEGAITIGGSSVLTASCGLAALSTDATAIKVNGNPTVDAGWILAAGGIDQWLKDNTDDVIIENMEGLYDPFEELTPPNPTESRPNRTYSCSAEPTFTTADIRTRTVIQYDYFQGSNERNATGWSNGEGKEDTDLTTDATQQSVPNGTTEGTVESSSVTWRNMGGNGNNRKWERKTETVYKTYSNITTTGGAQAGSVRPGTYSGIHVGCNTAFAPGVYNIVGGGLKITGQHEVTGSGVMFVLYDGAWIDIAGGADINLTAMQASDLMSLGVGADEANRLAGMLVFEDRNSRGSGKTKMNGNANTVLNGTMYFPVSEVFFAGTVGVTSQCLMIAANNITITGTTNMSTFCPAGSSEDEVVATTAAKVRLVA
ncbi:TadE/TadG family type IV pilus assembly protein [Erythrobacter alti]|uniref:TadE/TadG family type IV pilus assembly protein n=1 Tax=Erythrobacter alti TaxID=1896145 RepID=UPI0030F3D7C7